MGFVCLNLYFSVSWLVDFQWGSCGSIFSFLCYGRQTFSGVRVAQSSFLCHGWQTFSGVRVALSLVLCHGRQTFSGVRVAQYLILCHGRQTFSGVRVAQSFVFYVMVGRLLVGFVWHNLQFYVSWLVYFQWGSCCFFCVMVGRPLVGFVWLNVQSSMSWQVNFQWGSCGSIFSFLCHGWQIFRGVRVAQSLVLCVMVDRLLVGFVWFNLQFSVS